MGSNIVNMNVAISTESTSQQYQWQNLTELISHIEQTHHVFTKTALAHIKELLSSEELISVFALTEIKRCFVELEADLTPHLMKEERILFPYIVELEGDSGQPPTSCFSSVANPINMMEIEHQAVKDLLEQLRKLTGNYRPQSDNNSAFSALYTALASLDNDLVQHIHLENDVLFPQVLQMERNIPR